MEIFKPISYQRKYTTLYYLMEQAYGSYIEVKRIILLVSFLEFFAINQNCLTVLSTIIITKLSSSWQLLNKLNWIQSELKLALQSLWYPPTHKWEIFDGISLRLLYRGEKDTPFPPGPKIFHLLYSLDCVHIIFFLFLLKSPNF